MIFGVAAAVLLVLRFRERPTWLRAAAVGAMCGFLVLTCTEMILVVPLLLVPLMLFGAGTDWRQRIVWLAVGGAIAAIVIAPWVLYNRSAFRRTRARVESGRPHPEREQLRRRGITET